MQEREIREQMAQFAAARIGAPVDLQPTKVNAVVAAHDGTDQDATVDALAQAIAQRTGAAVSTLRPGPEPLPELLAASAACDVIVVPSPFGRDYAAEGQQSLSTTIDLLLARSEAAVCIARAPIADPARCVASPLVALQVDRHRKVEATAMAVALAQHGGDVVLLSVVDPQRPTHSEELLGRSLDPHDLSPEVLHGLASARAAALTSVLQRHAGVWRLRPHVHFGIGDAVSLALAEGRARGGVLVAGRCRDAASSEAQDARRLVLGSALPVLLV